jgi:hypothetical protein
MMRTRKASTPHKRAACAAVAGENRCAVVPCGVFGLRLVCGCVGGWVGGHLGGWGDTIEMK